MNHALTQLLSTARRWQEEQQRQEEPPNEHSVDVIRVSDTVSVAASVYETVRNTLEYDEEHLLRRNAIRRILRRRLGEGTTMDLAEKLLRELIWAKYLPNNRIPAARIEEVENVLNKYRPLFEVAEDSSRDQELYDWVMDVLSTEIEYLLVPPYDDEALASYAYYELNKRIEWETTVVQEEDREMQLYIAVHRAVLKSNPATLRYRILTLFYRDWRTASANDPVVNDVRARLEIIKDTIEAQITHPGQDSVYRFVRKHAVVFRLISDVAKDNPDAFEQAVALKDATVLDAAISSAASDRYAIFRTRLTRTVLRAAVFLLMTKSILAFLVEYPYEVLVLQTTDFLPLAINIGFPPLLLAVLGLTVRIPKKKNTERILDEVHAILGLGEDMTLQFRKKTDWGTGTLWVIFNMIYFTVFILTISAIVWVLRQLEFNVLSIFFFVFFLSLVAYFGIRIRNTRRELVVVDKAGGFLRTMGDVVMLPIVRVGRWIALRAPRVNIFLFFFDFIIEAPFKAAIGVIESWLAFMREKREEI